MIHRISDVQIEPRCHTAQHLDCYRLRLLKQTVMLGRACLVTMFWPKTIIDIKIVHDGPLYRLSEPLVFICYNSKLPSA